MSVLSVQDAVPTRIPAIDACPSSMARFCRGALPMDASVSLACAMAATTTSCGVLLLNPERELLLCHATGAAHWDIPKGLGEPGEAARDTALRELFEETGLRLQSDRLLDLGAMAYRPGKDLHLFAAW